MRNVLLLYCHQMIIHHHYYWILEADEVLLYQYDFWQLPKRYMSHSRLKQSLRHQESDPEGLLCDLQWNHNLPTLS